MMEKCPGGEDMGHRPLREPMPTKGTLLDMKALMGNMGCGAGVGAGKDICTDRCTYELEGGINIHMY
jgi:hypothetical protein